MNGKSDLEEVLRERLRARMPGDYFRLLSITQVAKAIHCAPREVIQLIESGELPFVPKGRIRYILAHDVYLMLRRRAVRLKPKKTTGNPPPSD